MPSTRSSEEDCEGSYAVCRRLGCDNGEYRRSFKRTGLSDRETWLAMQGLNVITGKTEVIVSSMGRQEESIVETLS